MATETRRLVFEEEPQEHLAARAGYGCYVTFGFAEGDILGSQMAAAQQASQQQASQQQASQQQASQQQTSQPPSKSAQQLR